MDYKEIARSLLAQKKGQGMGLGFVVLAIGLIVGIISYIILNSIIAASSGNFTGLNATVSTYIPTLFLVGILVGAAMAAFVAMQGHMR
jgi:hypothetical protein